MRIVVLDGCTLNPGDLSWDGLAALGELRIYERTAPDLLPARARAAEILLTNKTPLGRVQIAQLPALKYIGVLATGYNVVDLQAAAERGIVVTNVPAYGTESVAQMTFAHLLNWCHHVAEHALSVRAGKWCDAADFCFSDFPLLELAGQTMGLVGIGRIGQAVARLAQAFGMTAIAHDAAYATAPLAGVEMCGLDDLLRRSDVVSLHCPLTPATERLIDGAALRKMRRHAFLINTSRGPLIDEEALAQALEAGTIAGAGLDVLAVEPARRDNPLLRASHCYITPHIAWATRAARRRLLAEVVENVAAFLRGETRNAVRGAPAP